MLIAKRRDDRSRAAMPLPTSRIAIKCLKIRGMGVDVVIMRSKLSQALGWEACPGARATREPAPATNSPGRDRLQCIHACWIRSCSIVFLLVSFGTACSEDRSDTNRRSERDPIPTSTTAAVDRNAESFRWPDAVDHPRVEIKVELQGQEATIRVELVPELAPESVERVLSLTRNGYYDGTTFHRVIPGFMIQGGDPNSRDQDPTNDGRGGDRTPIPDEFSTVPFERGVVALANRAHGGSTSAQLFIMHAENRGLDGHYNVIGRVEAGLDVVDAIAQIETDRVGRWGPKDRPIENVVIRQAKVIGPASVLPPTGTSDEPASRGAAGTSDQEDW